MIRRLGALDRLLIQKGFPPISPWWQETLIKFYRSGKKQLALRVGRRGGKSSTLCRLAVVEALWGKHKVPPGDLGFIAIVSVNLDEANGRLRTIKAILDAINVKYKPVHNGIEIEGKNVGFKVYAATIAGVSGFTAVGVIGDELSKWRDSDSGKNPATEVLASIKPTIATQPEARMLWSSSPLGMEDAHAKMLETGDTNTIMTAVAPTWIANPTISEQKTRDDEPDERIWRREYAAIPQGSSLGAFDPDSIDYAFRDISQAWISGPPVIAMDPAGRGSDKFVVCAAGWHRFEPNEDDKWVHDPVLDNNGHVVAWVRRQDEDGNFVWNDNFKALEPVISFWGFKTYDSAFRQRHTAEGLAQRIGSFAKEVHAKKVISDQYEAFGLQALIQKQRLSFQTYTWSGTSKAQAVGRVRSWLTSGRIVLEKNDLLRREMLQFEEKITANGLSYGGTAPAGGHFDCLSCLLTTAMADFEGALAGGPTRRGRARKDKGRGDFGNP